MEKTIYLKIIFLKIVAISFNNLGNLGHLGNQMFQYAALKGIAAKHEYEYFIAPKENFGTKYNLLSSIYDVFNIEKCAKIQLTDYPSVSEKSFNFDKDLFENCPNNVDLFGYYQSEKYFKHIESEIKVDFTFKETLLLDANRFLHEFYYGTDVISLHVRRGDYLNHPNHHPVCDIEYYEKSLNYFPKNIPVIVFTDDLNWCDQQDLFDDERFIISENNDVGFDLCLMTLCNYHVIANSSLSWWGAWLSKSKKVVAPKKWFGDAYSGWKIEDRILKEWITL